MKKWIIGALAAMTALLGVGFGAGDAAADYPRQVPRVAFYGDIIPTAGFNNCHGGVHVSLKNDRRKPGWMQVTLRSDGFTRNNCKVGIRFSWYDTKPGFYHEKYFNVKGTRARGKVLAQKAVHVGQGVNLIAVTSTHPLSRGVSYYTLN
ncbi:hypothetical protein [Gordonia sihwensis]|uniref:hypothetical protein n=1 Tax=Gordonia sihwensis TaxID=173559 RepID=UPI003D967A49